MTPEQARTVYELAAAWSLASFHRGNDQGRTPSVAVNDREAAETFRTYLEAITEGKP